jgi:hypothetical protein
MPQAGVASRRSSGTRFLHAHIGHPRAPACRPVLPIGLALPAVRGFWEGAEVAFPVGTADAEALSHCYHCCPYPVGKRWLATSENRRRGRGTCRPMIPTLTVNFLVGGKGKGREPTTTHASRLLRGTTPQDECQYFDEAHVGFMYAPAAHISICGRRRSRLNPPAARPLSLKKEVHRCTHHRQVNH